MEAAATWAELREACSGKVPNVRSLPDALRKTVLDATPTQGLSGLLGRVLHPVWLSAEDTVSVAKACFAANPGVIEAALEDLVAITTRNLERGGLAWTWVGNRGFHVMVAHRVIHSLWLDGQHAVALALKAGLAPLGVDIHPAVAFGRRIFLDHGVGLVVGETATVSDDVSIWHGVTLGSTLMQEGDRHPKVGPGAIIGAGATVLGNIEVGEGAIVAAGSVVLRPVPPFTVVAGNPAVPKPGYSHPFGYSPRSDSEVP